MRWEPFRPIVANDTNSFAEFCAIRAARSGPDRQSQAENCHPAKGDQPLCWLQMLCYTESKADLPATHASTRRRQMNRVHQSAPGNNYRDTRNGSAHGSAMRCPRLFLG